MSVLGWLIRLGLYPFPGRRQLRAARTYYVRTADGSDGNNGLADTAGGAFATLQKAMNVVSGLDTAGFDVTIQARAGTYAAVALKSIIGGGRCLWLGDTATPANVLISSASSCFSATEGTAGVFNFQGFKLASSAGSAIFLNGKGIVASFSNMNYGVCGAYHNFVSLGASITGFGTNVVSGGSFAYVAADTGAYCDVSSSTVSFTASVAFGVACAYAIRNGFIMAFSMTFTLNANTITGTRYSVSQGAEIFTASGGANYFPGNSAGSSATQGQYL